MELVSLSVHLAELRRRLWIVLIVWIGFSFGFYPWSLLLLDKITAPFDYVIFTDPMEVFSARMGISFLGGVIFGGPVIAWQIWAFIRPAMGKEYGRILLLLSLLSTFFFVAGVLFGHFVAVPLSLKFLLSSASEKFLPMISVSNYLNFWRSIVVAMGVTFLLPLVMAFLAMMRLVKYKQIASLRRYLYVLIFIVSAVLGPPEVVSQISLAIPMIILFEIGVLSVRVINNRE
ncbi:MAG: twin-arginine translocase subunit TatC [Candidatus Omnitrophica bacterium]|nr:twin-arginine translocase subunit TatC [Candidatus Omnitrophota bacterium]